MTVPDREARCSQSTNDGPGGLGGLGEERGLVASGKGRDRLAGSALPNSYARLVPEAPVHEERSPTDQGVGAIYGALHARCALSDAIGVVGAELLAESAPLEVVDPGGGFVEAPVTSEESAPDGVAVLGRPEVRARSQELVESPDPPEHVCSPGHVGSVPGCADVAVSLEGAGDVLREDRHGQVRAAAWWRPGRQDHAGEEPEPRVAPERLLQSVRPPRCRPAVVVYEGHEIASGRPRSGVASPGRPRQLATEEPRTMAFGHFPDASVARRGVDHEHLVAASELRAQCLERAFEHVHAITRGDDDAERRQFPRRLSGLRCRGPLVRGSHFRVAHGESDAGRFR